MFSRRSLKSGFTLVELLVVISIIGVLATLLLLQLGGARGKARDIKRISDITQLRTAIEQYFDDNGGKYPQMSLYDATVPLRPYIGANTPTDPLNQAQYGYATNGNLKFQVWAELEVGNPALKSDTDIDGTTGWTARTAVGRMNTLVNGLDTTSAPGGICDNNTLTNNNCVFDLGTP